MCLYSNLVPNPKYKPNKKNGGIIAPVSDERIKRVPIKCGECIECRKAKAREWQQRMLEDIKTNTNGKFITLTFSNASIAKLIQELNAQYPEIQGYALDNAIATIAIRRFNERWRKEYKTALRHWTITELGHKGTENIHLHGIIWTNEPWQKIEHHWKYGYIWPTKDAQKRNYVNGRTINYIIKYITKKDEKHKTYKSIILTSPGIGRDYTKTLDFKKHKYNNDQTIETYKTNTGHKMAMPIYWRNKAYTEDEREKLWIHKLNKQQRWICGEKIDISKTEEQYYKILKWYQDKNTQLGYGNGHKDWTQKKYEEQRRALTQKQRIQNAFGEKLNMGTDYKNGRGKHTKANAKPPSSKSKQQQHISTKEYILSNITRNTIIQIHKNLWMISKNGIKLIDAQKIYIIKKEK